MENVGERLTDRRIISKVIGKLMPPKGTKQKQIRDPIDFSTAALIQYSMRQTWIRATPPKMRSKKDLTARASGMLASSFSHHDARLADDLSTPSKRAGVSAEELPTKDEDNLPKKASGREKKMV